MTARVETKRVPALPDEDGWFSALVYRVNAEPDGDGDVIAANAVEDGTPVVVSAWGHDVNEQGAEPAGEATLYHAKGGVIAVGFALPTARGRLLRQNLRAPDVEWSITYTVIASRRPTRQEREQHPATRRIILRMAVAEVSPVAAGSCGPSCRTLTSRDAKCAGPCCAVGDVRAAALAELAQFEHRRFRRLVSDLKHREALRDIESRASRRASAADGARAILERHELRPDEVDRETQWAALEAVQRAANVLGSEAPRVRWYSVKAVPLVEALGVHFPREAQIWLAARGADDVYEVALHETYHALRGADETAAKSFAERLGLLRHTELNVGARANFEDRLEWGRPDTRWAGTYLEPPPPRLHLVGGLPAGDLVVDGGVLYEMQEDFGWHRVADLIPA